MKEIYDADTEKQNFVVNDAFITLKRKQILASEDLDEANSVQMKVMFLRACK